MTESVGDLTRIQVQSVACLATENPQDVDLTVDARAPFLAAGRVAVLR